MHNCCGGHYGRKYCPCCGRQLANVCRCCGLDHYGWRDCHPYWLRPQAPQITHTITYINNPAPGSAAFAAQRLAG